MRRVSLLLLTALVVAAPLAADEPEPRELGFPREGFSVKVPAGSFQALVVRSTLRQASFRFGSGTRTSYFAPDVGLVKLVFRHADGSVSTAVLLSAR